MGDLNVRLEQAAPGALDYARPLLGQMLVETGKIRAGDLAHALRLQQRIDAPIGEILVAEGLVDRKEIVNALELQTGFPTERVGPDRACEDLSKRLPVDLCMKHGAVPWRAEQNLLHVAVSSPKDFDNLWAELDPSLGHVAPVIIEKPLIQTQQSKLFGLQLAQKAELRVASGESCRGLDATRHRRLGIGLLICILVATAVTISPVWVLTAGILLASMALFMTTALKAAAFCSTLLSKRQKNAVVHPFRMPRVSVLVPLLHEREIAEQLIRRLTQLTYPKSLLDVVLVLEQNDSLTRETIAHTDLPDWMSVVEVPQTGTLTTKPRALNYALNFCHGSIVGVWDAEDWPEADQIEKVVTRFSQAPDNVVCLQGMLDYYNSRTNWLTRCFTIEYGMWWRLVMPGIARLGLVVPLGGTTLFFKRSALEELGGWDAHNVTEDADLGIRLARHGYATEILHTVTREEATSRGWSWVRQRSRWLKGFLITYIVHMRSPRKLLRDLGVLRFLGVQTLFLASVLQFATAPMLWSFWITVFGVTHPVEQTLGTNVIWVLAGLFILSEALNVSMGCVAVSNKDRRHLLPFVLTLMPYFAIGALAAYKAIWEIFHVPFFWDKTQHGVSGMTDTAPAPVPKAR